MGGIHGCVEPKITCGNGIIPQLKEARRIHMFGIFIICDSQYLNMEVLERFWCREGGRTNFAHESSAPDEPICPDCGSEMSEFRSRGKTDRTALAFQDWSEEVVAAGKWGSSPGGASGDLGCDRSMIDKLEERGLLEKSIYDRDGIYLVMISGRSIDKAKENKCFRTESF
jgi:hypothetical protein